ncbi:hypothetical protein KQI84_09905 [bacterium]|nr:hypothetical protein [bacterium]
MTHHDCVVELRQVLTAQHHLLDRVKERLSLIEDELACTSSQAQELRDLNTAMNRIEENAHLLEASDMAGWEDDEALLERAERSRQSHSKAIEAFQYSNWNQFVRDSQAYCLANKTELILPWEAFLTDDDFASLKSESYSEQYRWDKWDYILVGAAGVLAFLTDCFLVTIPADMTSGIFAGQKGSVITKRLHEIRLPKNVQDWLELAKVPYDRTGGPNHRIDTFGHDPVIGLIVGVLDIFRGTATTIKGGTITSESVAGTPGLGLTESIIIQILHLLSDAFTKKGLPIPFSSVLRALNSGSFVGPSGKSRTISDLTRWMYHHGYDLRHFMTMSITPATIEIILRAYIMIRHYVEKGEIKFLLADNPKYRSMLLSAHAIACAGNAGKISLLQGNPLAINYAEWLALIRYLLPSLKYWVFDRRKLELEHMRRLNDEGWDQLLAASDELLTKTYQKEDAVFVLGAEEAPT